MTDFFASRNTQNSYYAKAEPAPQVGTQAGDSNPSNKWLESRPTNKAHPGPLKNKSIVLAFLL